MDTCDHDHKPMTAEEIAGSLWYVVHESDGCSLCASEEQVARTLQEHPEAHVDVYLPDGLAEGLNLVKVAEGIKALDRPSFIPVHEYERDKRIVSIVSDDPEYGMWCEDPWDALSYIEMGEYEEVTGISLVVLRKVGVADGIFSAAPKLSVVVEPQ